MLNQSSGLITLALIPNVVISDHCSWVRDCLLNIPDQLKLPAEIVDGYTRTAYCLCIHSFLITVITLSHAMISLIEYPSL
jgi:hypothetical protein